MQRITNPVPIFLNASGTLLNGGKLYLGEVGADPATTPIAAFYDKDLTIAAPQPLAILGGRIVNESLSPASVYVAEDNYSMRVVDAVGGQVDYLPSVASQETSFQPQDDDLTAIADQGTNAFGRGLLTLSSQAALKDATGIPDPLPVVGGIVKGEITRQAAGSMLYWANPGMARGSVWLLPAGSPDPTTQPGDMVFYY